MGLFGEVVKQVLMKCLAEWIKPETAQYYYK